MARFNFKGWDIKKWLVANKETVKLLIVFIAGYNYMTGFDLKPFIIGIGALLGKLAIDSIDYYVSK